jgi:AcrR family transcriptional regulator
MPRPRTTTDDQILEQARACFLEHGAGVSTTVIAERLGVSHATLFQRFGTKEQLMLAALLPPPEPTWMALARSGPDGRDPKTQLLELADAIFAFLLRTVPGVAVLRSAGLHREAFADRPEDLPPIRARREIVAWFARAAERNLLRGVEPEHLADLFLGALLFRPFQQHITRKGFGERDNLAYLAFAVGAVSAALKPVKGRSQRASRPARVRQRVRGMN